MAGPWNHQVFDRLRKSLDNYEKQGNVMEKMNRRMTSLEQHISRPGKRSLDLSETVVKPKKKRVQLPLVPTFDSDQQESASTDETNSTNPVESNTIEDMWSTSSEDSKSEGEISDDDMLSDLQAAFQHTSETGPSLDKDFCQTLNPKLRQMLPEGMIKILTGKHKRPDNFTNLQVPKSDNSVWSAFNHRQKLMMLPFKKC